MRTVFSKKSTIVLFLLPALIVYTLVVFVPIIWSAYYSFFNWDGFSSMSFIGFNNFHEMFFEDKAFWPIVSQTLVYTIIQLIMQVGFGLIVAVLLNMLVRSRPIFQTLYYIPAIISSVAICQIFDKLLSVFPTGLINHILSFFNPAWINIEWLSSPELSLIMTAFVEGYKNMPVYMVIFFAALIAVPPDLCDAAKIDGASQLQTYLHVKIPYIKNVIIANSLLVLNNSLRAFDVPYILTYGGPGTKSEVLASYMYKQAFSSMRYGYGSAIAVFIVVICVLMASTFLKFYTDNEGNV